MSAGRFRFTALLAGAASVAGLVALAFLAGAWNAWRDEFPFRDGIRNSFLAAAALLEARREEGRRPLEFSHVWRRGGPRRGSGVTVHDPARATPGLRLVLAGQAAHLVDVDGVVRHTWARPYEELGGRRPLLTEPVDPRRIYWWAAHLYASGDLLVIVDIVGRSPEGLALAKLDRDSRPLWVFDGHVHHDLDVGPDGRIAVLGQEFRERPPPGLKRLRGPLLDDRVYILDDAGRLLEEIPLLDAFAASPYASLVDALAGERRYVKGDYLHVNAVDRVDAAAAARFPFLREGQLLLSFRELGAIAALDPVGRAITWARTGPWHQQHDPDLLDNGHLLLFDNRGDWDRGAKSRVLEIDPATNGIVWTYPAPGGTPLDSNIRGDQQRLPNGNTLINEQVRGRVLEVTPGGDVVWEYLCDLPVPGSDPSLLYNPMTVELLEPGRVAFPLNGGKVPAGPAGVSPPASGR